MFHAWEEVAMSIRMLAIELYRVMREIEELERKIKESALNAPEREKLWGQLQEARKERDRIRAMLEGAKE
jgi:cell division protein FtsL